MWFPFCSTSGPSFFSFPEQCLWSLYTSIPYDYTDTAKLLNLIINFNMITERGRWVKACFRFHAILKQFNNANDILKCFLQVKINSGCTIGAQPYINRKIGACALIQLHSHSCTSAKSSFIE